MAEYALWKTSRYYLAGYQPVAVHESPDYLEGLARGREWPSWAMIAQSVEGKWLPIEWVLSKGRKPLTPDQPHKYVTMRDNGGEPWDEKHFGPRPTGPQV